MEPQHWTQTWMVYGQLALVVIGALYALATFLMLRKLSIQLKSTSRHSLAALSNEHNWKILTFRDALDAKPTLPDALPSWRGLSPEGWRWRVLHLNHLNLVRTAWEDSTGGVLSPREVRDWRDKAQFIFEEMRGSVPALEEGRKQLRQLMLTKEGYPDAFAIWLVDNGILSEALVPDLAERRRRVASSK